MRKSWRRGCWGSSSTSCATASWYRAVWSTGQKVKRRTMKAVISTESQASVDVRDDSGEVRRGGEVSGPAVLALGGSGKDGGADGWGAMVRKIAELRLFPAWGEPGGGQRDLSVEDVGGSVRVVRQVTLMGQTKRGRRRSRWEA